MKRVRNGMALIGLAVLLMLGIAGWADRTPLTLTQLELLLPTLLVMGHGVRLVNKGERQ